MKVQELIIAASARVYDDEQGKDYEEPVLVTLGINVPSQEWHVRRIEHVTTGRILWP